MRRATRRVRPEDLRELLAAPPRANLVFRRGDEVDALPVAFRLDGGRYCVGVPRRGEGAVVEPGETVKLLIDDGTWFFDLRGVWVRGRTVPADPRPAGAPASLVWYEITPDRTAAWDYGTLRTVTGGR
ncbi:MAG TPA: hypothetical protein VFZ77_23455 [Acidimicrobiales bacterium]